MSKYSDMTNDYLRQYYVPAVYQPNIYSIDYQKLEDFGIKLISFDIDDTIAGQENGKPPKEAKILFEHLKQMGFRLILVTNANQVRASKFAASLGITGKYIARAKKPLTEHFTQILQDLGLEANQMAHVGNSQRDDIAGGNAAGITTCLVRRAGIVAGLVKRIPGYKTEGQKLRVVLKERDIWRKHHKYEKGDQYYQLGELPKYRAHTNDIK